MCAKMPPHEATANPRVGHARIAMICPPSDCDPRKVMAQATVHTLKDSKVGAGSWVGELWSTTANGRVGGQKEIGHLRATQFNLNGG
jgi:hypothetical protein